MDAASQADRNIVMVGLSGPSSAGKTSLAHQLSRVFPSVVLIVHADDFFVKDREIVNGYPDGEGLGGVDWVRMVETLDYVKVNGGNLPRDFKSYVARAFPGHDLRALGMVSPQLYIDLQEKVKSSKFDFEGSKIVIVDGITIYKVEEVRKRLDAKLFIRLSHQTAKYRRMTRLDYRANVKPEQLWKTENYFDVMVWPTYVAEHAVFFKGGNVEGEPDEEKCAAAGIDVQPGLDVNAETTLCWATEAVLGVLMDKI